MIKYFCDRCKKQMKEGEGKAVMPDVTKPCYIYFCAKCWAFYRRITKVYEDKIEKLYAERDEKIREKIGTRKPK